jgi:hypothetical protein
MGAAARTEPGDGRIKSWIDIHRMANPDELRMPDLDDPGPLPGAGETSATWMDAGTPHAAAAERSANQAPPYEPGADWGKVGKPGTAPQGVVALPPGWWKRHRMAIEESASVELDEAGQVNKPLPKWMFAALTVGACLTLLALVGWLVRATIGSSGRWREGAASPEPAAQTEKFSTTAVQQLVENFLRAETSGARLALVRDPERVRPLVEGFAPAAGRGKVIALAPYEVIDEGGLLVGQYLVTFDDNRRRTVCVVRTPDGIKVDWEAYSRQGGASFEELRAGLPGPVALRVVIGQSSYYNFEFQNEQDWLAFDIVNGDWESGFTGYVKRGDPLAAKLQRIINDSGGAAAVILKVSVDGVQGPRSQCVIQEFLEFGWVDGAGKPATDTGGQDADGS